MYNHSNLNQLKQKSFEWNKVYDKDLLSFSDFISEATLDFGKKAKLAYDNNTSIQIKENGDDQITV